MISRKLLAVFREDSIALLVRGASHSLYISILGTGIAFFASVVLARILGAEEYGLYVYILSWLAVISLVSQVGFKPALVRFVAAYVARQQWSLARGVITYMTTVSFVASLVVGVVAGLLAWIMRDRLGTENARTFLMALPLVVFLTIAALRAAGLRALKRVVLSAVPETIIRPIFIAAGVAAAAYFAHDLITAGDALLINVVATFLVFILGTILLVTVLPTPVRSARPEYAIREWWRTSLPMFFSTGMNQILLQADIILVGAFLGATQAGFYAVASRLAIFANLGKQAADSITAPMISEFHATDQRIRLGRLVIFAARGVTAFTLAASLMLFLFGLPILRIFGPEFAVGYLPMMILLVGYLFRASFASAGFLLSMTGHQDQSALVNGVSAAINIALNVLLIPRFGLAGAAAASTITGAIWSVSLMLYARKLLNINPTAFAKMPALSKD